MKKFILKLSLFMTIAALVLSVFSTNIMAEVNSNLSNQDELEKVGGSACSTEGEYETEWHFVINQLNPPNDAPEYITVKFQNKGVIEIKLDKISGQVAHYTISPDLYPELFPGLYTDTLLEAYADLDDVTYGRFNLSHWPCVAPLQVTKTAETSYTRKWTWDIEKSADPTELGELMSGEPKTVEYMIKLLAIYEDSDLMISGNITITNPNAGLPATIESVEDVLDVHAGDIEVVCGVDFPYVLKADGTLECTYEVEVDNMEDTLNTVTVETSGIVPGGVGTVDVNWGDPEEVVDGCVILNDTYPNGPNNLEVCWEDLAWDEENEEWSWTTTYDVTFGKDGVVDIIWECSWTEYENTARFEAVDSDQSGSASATVTGSVTCVLACGLSQGYWFANPKADWGGMTIELGGKFYTQEDGKKIWNSSNKGGITDAKKAFLQYSALVLSVGGSDNIPDEMKPYAEIIEKFFEDKEITGNNIKGKHKELSQAADAISNWISENHCEE